MTTIKLQTALKLIRFNHDDPEIREVIQATIDELERLYQVEAQFKELQEQAAPDEADWQMANRVAKG